MAPNPVITSVTWPRSPKEAGVKCKTDVTYRNDGTDGEVFSRIVDDSGNVLTTLTSSVAAGEISTDSLYFAMPSHDITIYAQVGVDSTVTSQKGPKTIEIGHPKADLLAATGPDSAYAGDAITLGIKVKNISSCTGQIWGQIYDRDTGTKVRNWVKYLAAGGTHEWIGSFTMPNKNWRLAYLVGHYENSSAIEDERTTKTITLKTTEPKGSIVSYDAPASATPGDTVTVSATAKNIGTGSGTFRFRLQDRDENVDVDSTSWFTLSAGLSSPIKTLSGTMPDRDWNLKLLLERTLPTGAIVIDDEKTFTAVNIVNWWDAIRAWWNSLEWWQKTLLVGTPIVGATVIVAKPYKKR